MLLSAVWRTAGETAVDVYPTHRQSKYGRKHDPSTTHAETTTTTTRPMTPETSRTHLRSQFQHILEPHPHVRQPALQQHDHVRIVLFHLLGVRARPARLLGADIRLQRRDLGVERGDVLSDYVGQLGDLDGPVVE